MGRAKANAKAVVVDGRTYHPTFPASEQDDVEHITKKKFKGMTPAVCANVSITKEELQNFAKVYPRLYQVGKKNQDRFKAWKKKHEDEIRGWDIGDFFKTKEDDEKDGTLPRKAGAPPEAVEECERQRAAEAAEHKQAREEKQRGQQVNQDGDEGRDEGSEEGPKMPTPRRSMRNARKASPELSTLPQVYNNEQVGKHQHQQPVIDSIPASSIPASSIPASSIPASSIPASSVTVAGDNFNLGPAAVAATESDPIGTVKMVAAHLKQLSDGADRRDHYKPALAFLSQQLRGAVAGLVAGKKRAQKDHDSDEDDMEDTGISETEEEKRIHRKRAQTVGKFGRQREGKAMRRK